MDDQCVYPRELVVLFGVPDVAGGDWTSYGLVEGEEDVVDGLAFWVSFGEVFEEGIEVGLADVAEVNYEYRVVDTSSSFKCFLIILCILGKDRH